MLRSLKLIRVRPTTLTLPTRLLLPPSVAPANRRSSPSNGRWFTPSLARKEAGATDHALSAALQEEIKYEQETANETPATPEFLKNFQERNVWKLSETAGRDDVILTRSYGNEKIRVEFSVAELMNSSEDSDFDEFNESEPKGNEESGEDNYAPSYPIRVNIAISKSKANGALAIEAAVQDGVFVVEGVSYFSEGPLASDTSPEADWKRRSLYLGPQYDRLELSLQEKFDEFLKERGVGEELALFIPEYAEWKEQKEYVSWLSNVKSFVEV